MPEWQDPASSSPSGPLCHWGYKRVEGLCLLPLAGWAVGAPRHPHAAPGPSGPFSAPRQAACLSGLLLAQHAEPGMGSPRRARRVSGLTEAGKGCPLCHSAVVLFLRRSFPPSLCKHRAPVGVTSLPTFSPEEDPPSPPSRAYSGACHATQFTAINEERKVRVMGSGNLP